MEQHVARPVSYADRLEVEQEIIRRQFDEEGEADFDEPSGIEGTSGGGLAHVTMSNRPAAPETRQPLRTD